MEVKSYHKGFFLSFIEKLNANTIRYCIVGDYQNLPESVSHDIDLWTDNVSCFRKLLFEAAKENGFMVIIDNETLNGCNVAIYKCEKEILYLMKIDVLVDTSWKSIITLVDKKFIGDNIIPFKNFYVANPAIEAVMHFLYPLFEWGLIKKEVYKVDIYNYRRSNVFSQCLINLLGEKTTKIILDLIENNNWNDIQNQVSTLRRKALLKGLFKIKTYSNFLGAAYHTIKRKFKPSGRVLAFCGLDGAGKTTILDEMNYMFSDLLKSKKIFYGYWRPFVLPEIRELFGKSNSKAGVDKQAQKGVSIKELNKKPKNKIISFIKLLYYWLDFMLSGFKYGHIHQRGGIVLFDRHYIDMAVHPQRFDMNLSRRIILFMYKFIPKADYTFFLFCTPDEILKRKQEFTNDEITKMTIDYEEVGKKIKNFVPIHTNTTVIQEIDEILSHIAIK